MYFISVLFTVLSQLIMLPSPPVNHCTRSVFFTPFSCFSVGWLLQTNLSFYNPNPLYPPRATNYFCQSDFFVHQFSLPDHSTVSKQVSLSLMLRSFLFCTLFCFLALKHFLALMLFFALWGF